jgi:hypothetical protein
MPQLPLHASVEPLVHELEENGKLVTDDEPASKPPLSRGLHAPLER